jgi:hypothetical protein
VPMTDAAAVRRGDELAELLRQLPDVDDAA